MAVTRERFDAGLTYDEYKAQMTRNRERLEANEQQVQIDPADLAAFKSLPRPLDVLVLAEDWCGDVIANLPILGRLAAESGKLNLRVLLRDQSLDVMDQYLNQGKFRSIPVFVFFDQSFREIGRFVERPASVTELRARRRNELFAQHREWGSPETPFNELPEGVQGEVSRAMANIREETTAFANQEVIRELREIVERAPA